MPKPSRSTHLKQCKRVRCKGGCKARHVQAQTRYRRKLITLGYPSGIRKIETYLHQLSYNKVWKKANHDRLLFHWRKDKEKLRAKLGPLNAHKVFLYFIDQFERKYAKRTATQNKPL